MPSEDVVDVLADMEKVKSSLMALELLETWADQAGRFVDQATSTRLSTTVAKECCKPVTELIKRIAQQMMQMEARVNQLDAALRQATESAAATMTADLKTILMETASRLNSIEAKLDDRTAESSGPEPSISLYSDVTRSKQPKPKTLVVVRPKEGVKDLETADKVRSALQSKIDPVEKEWNIVGVRMRRGKEVVVEAPSRLEAHRMMADVDAGMAGLEAQFLVKKRPKVIVYGVDSQWDDEAILKALRAQNMEDIDYDEFKQNTAIIRRNRKAQTGTKTNDVVLEVAPKIFDGQRCCLRCGMEGHKIADCKLEEDKLICNVCKDAGKDATHAIVSTNCWAYRRAREQIKSMTDYGC
ncbi:hypothetical protein GE061_007430 [Apolygus lucorum]|uniref:CCHC-type domain-containing protein n=1 Tax=Apolygus lucorum TaxID=248454 RepID=A0A8S9WT72_APOLU|nr:hypothetical protein GE061_007430 [Apolygus lucorum]